MCSSLREVSHETETEQRHRISELEKELAGVDELHGKLPSSTTSFIALITNL